jgi:hypothetical protein
VASEVGILRRGALALVVLTKSGYQHPPYGSAEYDDAMFEPPAELILLRANHWLVNQCVDVAMGATPRS